MDITGSTLAHRLLDAARGVGTERAVDLALNALFVRWMTLNATDTAKGATAWESLIHAPSGVDLARQFADLAIYFDHPKRSAAEAVLEAELDSPGVSAVIHALDSSLPSDSGHALEILAEAFEAVLDQLEQLGKQAGEADTPAEVADLMVALTVRAGDRVLDPACGNGRCLLAAARTQDSVSISGFEINLRTQRRAAMRMLIHGVEARGGSGVFPGDAFTEYEPGGVDVVLAQPPWNSTLTEAQERVARDLVRGWQEFGKRPTGDAAWLLLALDAVVEGTGRVAIVLPASTTGRMRPTWEHLIRRGAVEAAIALPPGVFSHTNVASVLWLLHRPSANDGPAAVTMVNASSLVNVAGPSRRIALGPDAIPRITALLGSRPAHRLVDAPAHLARTVSFAELMESRDLAPSQFLAEPPQEPVLHPAPERTLLTEIALANFKAFGGRTAAPLAPLTLVYGPNSAGKSSIIQALLMLKQSRSDAQLRTQGSLVNLGSFQGVVHGHAEDGDVDITLSYGALPQWIKPSGGPNPALPRSVRWTFAADSSGHGWPARVLWTFGEHQMPFTREPGTAEPFVLALPAASEIFAGLASGTLLYPFDSRGDVKNGPANAKRAMRGLDRAGIRALTLRPSGLMPSAESTVRLPQGRDGDRENSFAIAYVNRAAVLAGAVSAEVDQLLEEMVWLGPLRSAPQRVYDRASTSSVPGDGANVAMYLFDHASVVEQVNDWLSRLEVPYTIQVVSIGAGEAAHLVGDLVAISLTDTRTGVAVTPADVGYGISQVLPIVVELLSQRDCVIAVEQPETHLHPRLQARLADLLIDSTQAGGRGNQLIVETHSEHLMLRVQRRIREGALDPATVSVLYVDRAPAGPATVRQLRLNDQGDFFDEWPGGFFDDRLGELFPEL